ncbi:MAG: inositol monophosphatase [Pseudomonadota bacterium]
MSVLADRRTQAEEIARSAGGLARDFFRDIGSLDISAKTGALDLVSNADIAVEKDIRAKLIEAFPDDGIIGEEHAPVPARSDWTWVIDPIDGTANFVVGLPQWCVILACVQGDGTRVGVIYDPCADEMFSAAAGYGARLNGEPMRVARASGLDEGRIGLGMNGRTPAEVTPTLLLAIAEEGGLLFHNASGGLMLAYVAAGRLIGFAEPHMNAWDCLAGQLIVREAGGRCEPQSAKDMLADGGRVVVATPGIFDRLQLLADKAYSQ